MADGSLHALVRLRRLALVDARKRLAVCLAVERDAETAEREAEAAIESERLAAAVLGAEPPAAQAFAAWLPRGRAACSRAAAQTTAGRAELQAHRAALEAAETLQAQHEDAERQWLARREELELAETAQHARISRL